MKKLIFMVLLIVLPLVLITGFIFLNSEPDKLTEEQREKAIDAILGRKANLNPDIKTGNSEFSGKFGQFKYPASAEIYEYKDPGISNNKNLLESFSFDMDSPRRIFNYTVMSLEPNINKLEDISSVNFRKNPSNGYTQKEEKLDTVTGLTFTKNRSGEYMAEKSGFFLVNGKLYSISISSSNLADVSKLYDQITKTFVVLD